MGGVPSTSSEELDPVVDAVAMAAHPMRHCGDIQFASKQEFDGEEPVFFPSRLLSTMPFAEL
jgi:hypothetical protein